VPSDDLPASAPAPEASVSSSAPAPASADPLSGRIVGGRWRVLRRLDQGGMGAIYEAQNVAIGKRVALKFIHNWGESAEACLRFQREAEAASAVESAHIVQIFDTGTTDEGQPYLVMELLQGESLGARLRRGKRLTPAEAIQTTAQVLRGLARAHEAGVIHRDLKPDNVFLVPQDDGALLAKILDFGISKIRREEGAPGVRTITREGTVLGTPFYMSPEQAQALPELDARSDLFSVGVILFECLAGQLPWASLSSYEAVIVAICSRDAPDVRLFAPEVSAPLAEALKVALARDATRRFPSARAFLEALQGAAPGLLSSGGERSRPPLAEGSAESGAGATWTPREPLAPVRTPTLRWPAPAPSRRWLGGGAALLLAFVGTWLALHRSAPAPLPQAAASALRPPPEVSMLVEVSPPGARLLIDGQPPGDGVLRGPALSEHEIQAEAAGFRPVRRRVLLDGRPALRIELEPLPTEPPATSASADTAEPPPARPSAVKAASSASRPAAPEPSAGTGLRLKEKL
jgi:tRNA A-37 threonylcarbamoyl transferase component Bud32